MSCKLSFAQMSPIKLTQTLRLFPASIGYTKPPELRVMWPKSSGSSVPTCAKIRNTCERGQNINFFLQETETVDGIILANQNTSMFRMTHNIKRTIQKSVLKILISYGQSLSEETRAF